MRKLLIILPLLLSGCAGIKAPEGFECDSTGACWPSNFEVTVPIRYVYHSPQKVDEICRKGSKHIAHKMVYACAIPGANIIILPTEISEALQQKCGLTIDKLRRHEEGHIMGVTVHDMVERSC